MQLFPFDLIPDMIPFVGQIDDVYLVALTLLRLMERTDPKVVREHWTGGGDVVELVGAAAQVAAKFLPPRIRRVLTSRLEVAPGKIEDLKSLPKPLLIERPEPEAVSGQSRQKAESRRQIRQKAAGTAHAVARCSAATAHCPLPTAYCFSPSLFSSASSFS